MGLCIEYVPLMTAELLPPMAYHLLLLEMLHMPHHSIPDKLNVIITISGQIPYSFFWFNISQTGLNTLGRKLQIFCPVSKEHT